VSKSRGTNSFASEIATALGKTADSERRRIKTVAHWTGANERTVKNWLSGRYGPSGDHLVLLARHSQEVLDVFLAMAGRRDLQLTAKLDEIEKRVAELATFVEAMKRDATR
jgi:hypothetical protein